MPLGTGLPSTATCLFNRPITTLLPQINGEHINISINSEPYEAVKPHQDKYLKGNDTCKGLLSFPIGSTVAVQ